MQTIRVTPAEFAVAVVFSSRASWSVHGMVFAEDLRQLANCVGSFVLSTTEIKADCFVCYKVALNKECHPF